jgi:hypothetical protein
VTLLLGGGGKFCGSKCHTIRIISNRLVNQTDDERLIWLPTPNYPAGLGVTVTRRPSKVPKSQSKAAAAAAIKLLDTFTSDCHFFDDPGSPVKLVKAVVNGKHPQQEYTGCLTLILKTAVPKKGPIDLQVPVPTDCTSTSIYPICSTMC